MEKISIISASRRPLGYKKLVEELEQKIPDFIQEYLVFVNDTQLKNEYEKLKIELPKIKVINAPEDYIYKNGFDSLYNLLHKVSKTDLVWILFDTDTIEIDKDKFKDDMEKEGDIYVYQTYMQRGDVWEKKMQLYNKKVIGWFGLCHENQIYFKDPKAIEIDSVKVIHNNALDDASKKLKKTSDGFIVLEKAEDGTDSYDRNLLYEGLIWKIVNGNGRHMNKAWFVKHYSINGPVIDYYHDEAEKKWGDK